MNKMYEYLKNHTYISYNKKSNYQFELSEERAQCIANKYDNLTDKLQQENKYLEQQCKKQKEVIDKVNKKLNNFIDCCKAEKLESGSDYIHHQYWDMFEKFNKQIKDILKKVSE